MVLMDFPFPLSSVCYSNNSLMPAISIRLAMVTMYLTTASITAAIFLLKIKNGEV